MTDQEVDINQKRFEDGLKRAIELVRGYIRLKPKLIDPFTFNQNGFKGN